MQNVNFLFFGWNLKLRCNSLCARCTYDVWVWCRIKLLRSMYLNAVSVCNRWRWRNDTVDWFAGLTTWIWREANSIEWNPSVAWRRITTTNRHPPPPPQRHVCHFDPSIIILQILRGGHKAHLTNKRWKCSVATLFKWKFKHILGMVCFTSASTDANSTVALFRTINCTRRNHCYFGPQVNSLKSPVVCTERIKLLVGDWNDK